MGKVVGLVGAASGKIGNVVYAVMNGVQTARVYQPVVYNPKSSLQNAQRAKGNLVGRISSFVPRTAIMGLGPNNRVRRGEFLRNLLKSAQVTINDNVYRAKIDDNDVIFSKGTVFAPFIMNSVLGTANTVTVTIEGMSTNAISEDEYASKNARLVVMVYDSRTQDLVEVITKIAVKPTQSATAQTIIPVNHPTGYTAIVYLIPMSTADGSAASIDTDMASKSDDDIQALLSVNSNSVVFNYGNSMFFGRDTFNPA